MPDEFDRMLLNAAFFFACPIDAGSALSTRTSTIAIPLAIATSAARNPSADSSPRTAQVHPS